MAFESGMRLEAGLTLGLVAVLVAVRAEGADGAEPMSLGPGPHLFVDDYLIEKHSGLARVVQHPSRLPEPVVTRPEDKCFQPYVTVALAPSFSTWTPPLRAGPFRIWYGVPESASQSHVAYMESDDGIQWERPHRVLEDPARIQFGVSILDEGPEYAEPSRRYKYGWWNDGGLQIASSPDGLTWTRDGDGVVLPHNHDINCIFRDPIRERYMAMVSTYTTGETWEGPRRIPMMSVSDDLLEWEEPWTIIEPDERDEGETQFYCMGGLIARGGLLIGMLRVLRDDLPADPGGPVAGIGYTVLAWSRDGRTWERDRDPFLDRNPERGAWDHAMSWGDSQLIVGDQVYLYYGGYAQGHKVNRFTERQIGLARLPLDRYVCREAGPERGLLRTPLVTLNARAMSVNADVDGELRVRALDGDGSAVPGFDWDDCTPIRGDSVGHSVEWTRPLVELRGRSVRLEFAVRRGKLFAFDLRN